MIVTRSGTRCVHIVDDDFDLRSSLQQMLSEMHYEVHSHATARDFLDRLDKAGPCCAIVDVLLPDMTGLALCRELVMIHACCPFVIISGHADLPTAVELMKRGAVDFLEKPCRGQTLAVQDRHLHVHQDQIERFG